MEVSGHNLIYHTETGDYSEYGTLKEVLKKLPETQFMKCNNCYLVNLGHVRGTTDLFLLSVIIKSKSVARAKGFYICVQCLQNGGGSDDYR